MGRKLPTCGIAYVTSYEDEEELELVVTVININPGCNRELLERCESLRGYMVFVKKARDKKAAGIKLENAVYQAVEECILEGILAEFFREHKKEIVEMGIFEFDQELHDKTLYEDGVAAGIEQGIELGSRIFKAIQSGVTDNNVIAETCECTIEEVERIRKQFGI